MTNEAVAVARSLALAECAAKSLNLRRGRAALASVAATAPLIGFLMTVQLLISLFHRGAGGERSVAAYWTMVSTADSLVPTGVCLATGLLAVWGMAWLDARVEEMELEIRKMLGLLEGMLRRWPAVERTRA